MKTKRLLSALFLSCLLSSLASAQDTEEFTIDGIKYTGDRTTMTATVTGTIDGFSNKDVVIPEEVNGYVVTCIGDRAFRTISAKSFVMPNTVTNIGYRAFYRCSELEGITVSNTLTTIADMAFAECTKLKSIVLPETISEIGALAFNECSSIESIEIPNNAPLETIQQASFMSCSKLKSFNIPGSVKVIKSMAFAECSSITNLYIPSSVIKLEYDAEGLFPHPFYRCSNLKSILVDKDNPVYDSRDNCNAIIETSINKLIVGCMNSIILEGVVEIGINAFYEQQSVQTSIEIPSTVTTIGDMAFSESSLTSIIIPSSVTIIGLGVFNRCESLTSATLPDSWESIPSSLFIFCRKLERVNIPASVKRIEEMAFRRCESLKTIDFPNSLEKIGEQAFQGCVSMNSILLPNSITEIADGAFSNCNSLGSVTSKIEEPFEINRNVFAMRYTDTSEDNFSTATLYVPKGTKEKYKATPAWNKFKVVVEIGEQPKGDVNGDMTVDVADIASVIDVMAKGTNDEAADVNKDGSVDVADIAAIIDEMAASARRQDLTEE